MTRFTRTFSRTALVVFICMGAAILLPLPAAHATDGFANGADLKEWCNTMETDDVMWGLCVGSITAGHDMVMTYQESGSVNKVVCTSKHITRGDAVDAVVKYLADHPEDLKYSLGDVVLSALADAFPCR